MSQTKATESVAFAPANPLSDPDSSRQLDALVAERVFKCRVIRYSKLSVGCGCSDEAHARGGDELKPFSGNMNDAMLVVEKMGHAPLNSVTASLGFATLSVHQYQNGEWLVHFVGKGKASADTLPKAICLAALEAVKESQ